MFLGLNMGWKPQGPPTLGLRDCPAIVQISPCNGEMELSVAMTDGWFQPTRVILLCKMIQDDISCISILTHTSIHAKSAQQRSAVLDSIRHGTHSHTHTQTQTHLLFAYLQLEHVCVQYMFSINQMRCAAHAPIQLTGQWALPFIKLRRSSSVNACGQNRMNALRHVK